MKSAGKKENFRKSEQGSIGKVRYVFYFAGVLLLLLSVLSYAPGDQDVLSGGVGGVPSNWIGSLGAYLSCGMFYLFGLAAYVLTLLVVCKAVRGCFPEPGRFRWFFWGTVLTMCGAVLLFALSPGVFAPLNRALRLGNDDAGAISGGVIGQFFAGPPVADMPGSEGVLRVLIGFAGTLIIGWACVFSGVLMLVLSDYFSFIRSLMTGIPAAAAVREKERAAEAPAKSSRMEQFIARNTKPEESPASAPSSAGSRMLEEARNILGGVLPGKKTEEANSALPPHGAVEDRTAERVPEREEAPEREIAGSAAVSALNAAPAAAVIPRVDVRPVNSGQNVVPSGNVYVLPPLRMLAEGAKTQGEDMNEIVRSKEILQRTLDSFKVSGTVSGHVSGPRLTRYEITLSPGVNVRDVERISQNIAMEMSAKSIRVLAPIPGRNAVGVETPNRKPESVFMRSVMESDAWNNPNVEVPVVLGKDVCGKPVVLDLAKAPHLLIAGMTGSGKSVCVNALIMSLLFRFRPDELSLIMVDPKIVEFEDYKTLPHLITPVVSDSRKVPVALRWAVNEMEKRYRLLARAGVKKLREYNSRPDNCEVLYDDDGMEQPKKLPYLLVIVDEFADLMMTDARKDAETSIARIAQKGRAAGVHIVLATQRPSKDIVTGVIKANLPTKIAFTVGSNIDSRVVLDSGGAEGLLGSGDMLFLPPGSGVPERVQGAWVSGEEIKKVVEFVSVQAPQQFNEQVVAEEVPPEDEGGGKRSGRNGRGGNSVSTWDSDDDEIDRSLPPIDPIVRKYMKVGDDENVRAALEIVIGEGKISTSYLQRRLGIGYNSAATIIDKLEERGVVSGPLPGGNKREILITDMMEERQ